MGFSITDMLNKDTSMAAAPVKDHTSNNLNVRGLRYSNFGVDCQMEVAFGFAVDTDGFMVVYTADYLL